MSLAETKTYEGRAFHPSLEGGQAGGELTVRADGLNFTTGSTSACLPLDGLRITSGGAADRLIFLAHPDEPDWSIYTRDRSLLDDPALAALPQLVGQIGRIRRGRRRGRLVTAAVLGVLAASLTGLALLKDPLIAIVAARVPTSVEVRLGEAAMAQLRIGERFVTGPAVTDVVARITDPIVAAIPDAGYPFHFHVVENPTLNAFALPGGNVVLHSGLLLAADNPGEVAGVVAHEIAHVTKRHSIRQILGSLGLYAIVQAFVGDASGIVAVLATSGADLLSLRFSRDFELEADDTAFLCLKRAQVDPKGLVSFFRKMSAQEEANGVLVPPGALTFLSTHPDTKERIARLEARLVRESASPAAAVQPLAIDYAAFKTVLRAELGGATPAPAASVEPKEREETAKAATKTKEERP